MKYLDFISILDDNKVYTPASIVANGFSEGLVPNGLSDDEVAKRRVMIRHTLARFSSNHQFCPEGDGLVTITGQAPMRGWFGFRWKEAAGIN